MSEICWRLVDFLSGMLEPDECDVVRGDFTESGETAGQALRDLLGLVIRRQAALWKDWRPWLILVGLIIPLGMLLSIVSRATAGVSATYVWLYANNWDWALLRYAGFWYVLVDSVTPAFVSCLTLVCWSWTAGFVLGSLTRRIVPACGVLFCLALVFGGLVGAPQYFAYLIHSINRPASADESDPISALVFYRLMLPFIVQVVLVAVPSLLGMRQGANRGRFTLLLRVVLWTLAILSLALLMTGFSLLPYWRSWIWQGQIQWLQFVAYWPVGYLAARLIGRRWHARAPAT
jgi:hypothetical protein